jgi:hypothetical protein
MIALAVVGFVFYRVSRSPNSKADAVLQMEIQNPPAPPQFDPGVNVPEQPPQMPNIQPPNGPPFGRMPPGNIPRGNMPRGNMPRGNMPPGNMRPGRNPAQRWPVVISNGRLGNAVGLRRTITISYEFVQGEPAPGQHYFVVIKGPHSSAEAQIMPFRMAKQGTFHIQEIGFGARDDGPFEAHLETGMPGPFGQREVVSNTITLSQ